MAFTKMKSSLHERTQKRNADLVLGASKTEPAPVLCMDDTSSLNRGQRALRWHHQERSLEALSVGAEPQIHYVKIISVLHHFGYDHVHYRSCRVLYHHRRRGQHTTADAI